jgi:hypothetical protein
VGDNWERSGRQWRNNRETIGRQQKHNRKNFETIGRQWRDSWKTRFPEPCVPMGKEG